MEGTLLDEAMAEGHRLGKTETLAVVDKYRTQLGLMLCEEAADIRKTVAQFRQYLRDCGNNPQQLQGVAEELCKIYLHTAGFIGEFGFGDCHPDHLPTA